MKFPLVLGLPATAQHPGALSVGIIFLLLLVAAVVIDYLDLRRKRLALQGIPIIGEGNYWQRRLNLTPLIRNSNRVLQHAFDTYTREEQPWALPFFRDYIVVLPPKALKDYQGKTPEHFSFVDSVNYAFGLHSSCPMTRDHVKAVQVSVSKSHNLVLMHDAIIDAIDEALGTAFQQEKDQEWHPFVAYEFIWPMMIEVATAYIIGPDFERENPGYVRHCVDFCCQASEFRDLRGMYPEILQPLVWPFSRCGRALQSTIARSKQQLMPEIRQRIARTRTGQHSPDHHTLVDATIGIKMKKGDIGRDTALAHEEKEVSGLAGDCLLSALEIAFPIAAYVIGMMTYAVADPEYADVLRDEIRSALHSTGGEWPIGILDQMPRLESFARETVRCDTTSVFTATRRLQEPLRLDSIGRTLDRGNFVSMPAQWLHQSPDFYPNPDTFDGCRFYDLGTDSCYPRAATGNPNFLPFGYGAEMCPGRGLGMRQAQLAFAKILLAFDVDSYPVRGSKATNRTIGALVTLNRELKLQWRRRSTS